jgi:hypothetical protein
MATEGVTRSHSVRIFIISGYKNWFISASYIGLYQLFLETCKKNIFRLPHLFEKKFTFEISFG